MANNKTEHTCQHGCEAKRLEIRLRRMESEIARITLERDSIARELLTQEVFQRILEWLRDPKPANLAFTAGIERQIACLLELDILPEIKRLRSRVEYLENHTNR